MIHNPRPGRDTRRSIIGPFTAKFHNLRHSDTFRRLETVARCNPLTSLFIGTFLTASAIPVTTFLAFLTGTFIFGLLALTAFQGGMLIFSTVILIACLVTPFFLSTILAMVAYFSLKILKRFHLYEPLNTPVPAAGHFIQLPVEILENVASRIQAITSANANIHVRDIPSSVHSTEKSREDREYNMVRERDEEDTSDDVRYGSELSDCAERQIRRRGLSTEAMNHVEAVLKPRPQATAFLSPLKHSYLTLAVNAFIGENHVIRRKKDNDVELD